MLSFLFYELLLFSYSFFSDSFISLLSSSILFSPAAGPTTYTCFSTQLLFLSFHLSLPTILFLYHFPHPRQHVSFPFLSIIFFSSFPCSFARLSLLLFKSLSSFDFYSLMLSLPFLLFRHLFSLSIVSYRN
jgi:hypothetical protein